MKTCLRTVMLISLGTLGLQLLAADAHFSVRPGDDLLKKRDEIRAARKPGDRAVVTFAPGVYFMSKTLVLDEKDSATVWRAEKPGTVKLSGGIEMPMSLFAPVRDAKRLASFPEEARGRILEADFSKLLPGELKPWPDGYNGMPPAPWLYCGDDPLEVAVYPNAGWTSLTNVIDSGLTNDPRNEFAARPGIFPINDAPHGRLWNLAEGVWTHGYWKHDWSDESIRLAEWNPETRVAKHKKVHTWGILGNGTCGLASRRFKILNTPAELDAPGEWWIDRSAKKLYYLPDPKRAGQSLFLVPDAPVFVKFEKVRDVLFENLTLAYSHGRSSGMVFSGNSRAVTVRNCSFFNFGSDAISLNGYENTVTGCTIARVGHTAVVISGGDRKALVNACNVLEKCDISEYGRFSRIASAIVAHGCGNAVRDCNVHDGSGQGISHGGNEMLYADNELHHLLKEMCDAGAVYTGYSTATLGNLLFGNYVHDMGDDPKLWSHRHGFYFDDCDWGDDAIGNTFARVGLALFIGGGNMHNFYNNLAVETKVGFHCDTRGESWERRIRGSFLPFVDGRSWAESNVMPYNYREAPWHVAYPQLADLIDDRPNLPHANEVTGNVFVNCANPYSIPGGVHANLADEMGVKGNSVVKTDKPEAFVRAAQPVTLKEAAVNTVKSPDGKIEVKVFLDVAARLSWSVKIGGRAVVERSALGVTVGYRDYGKLVVPVVAQAKNVKAAPFEGRAFNDYNDPMSCEAKEYNELEVPLRELKTGRVEARLVFRVFNGGVAQRWLVKGAGARRVYGEMTMWNLADGGRPYYVRRCANGNRTLMALQEEGTPAGGVEVRIGDAERGDLPRFRLQERGEKEIYGGVTQLVFPQAPRGWNVVGDVKTVWRVTLFK